MTIKKFFKRLFTPKQRSISVYAIFDHQPSIDKTTSHLQGPNSAPIYFAGTRTEALVALQRLLYFKYIQEFSAWLFFAKHLDHHTHPSFTSPLWQEFFATALPNSAASDFFVYKITYSQSELASVLRTADSCAPLFIPLEAPQELVSYFSKHTDPSGHIIFPPSVLRAAEYDPLIQSNV